MGTRRAATRRAAAPGPRLKQVRLDQLHPAPWNPRRMPKREMDALRRSLREFGAPSPAVVNADGTILGGHQRIEAARAEGWKTFPCVYVELSEDRARLLSLALNRIGGRWDDDALGSLLVELGRSGADVVLSGFDDREIDKLVRSVNGQAASPEVEDHEPASSTAPKRAKRGDVWRLGEHRVMCGDSFDADAMARLVGKVTPAMVLTDPPYAIYGSSTGVASDVADDKMVRPFFAELFRVVKAALPMFGHAYVHCDWRSWPSLWDGARVAGMAAKNCIVWDKGGGGLGANYQNGHEFVGFFAKVPARRGPATKVRAGNRPVHDVNLMRYPRPSGTERLHNAAKPVPMLRRLIENSSEEGDAVLDPFLGSGSTLMAADLTGRRCLGMEIDPSWVDVVIERWEGATGGKPTKSRYA